MRISPRATCMGAVLAFEQSLLILLRANWPGGARAVNSPVQGPVHGQGSSHNPIVYRPVHGQGSTHNPIVRTNHPKPGPCGVAGRPGDCHPVCRIGPHGECLPL